MVSKIAFVAAASLACCICCQAVAQPLESSATCATAAGYPEGGKESGTWIDSIGFGEERLAGGYFYAPLDVYNEFRRQGASDLEAQALTAVVSQEGWSDGQMLMFTGRYYETSERGGRLNPSGAFGIAQWNGLRQARLAVYATAHHLNPAELSVQVGFILQETRRMKINTTNIPDIVNRYESPDWYLRAEEIAGARRYVRRFIGRAEDLPYDGGNTAGADSSEDSAKPCPQVASTASRDEPAADTDTDTDSAPFAPWGIQLAGSFSKAAALASFAQARSNYASILGDVKPLIIDTNLMSRGTRPFYRIRVGEPNRQIADLLCNKILQIGGACVVLAN